MKSFFSFSFLFFSFLSLANHYDPDSPEFKASVELGQIQAAEKTQLLGEKISTVSLAVRNLALLVKEQADAAGTLGKSLVREFEPQEIYRESSDSDQNSSSEEASSSDSSDGEHVEQILKEGWLKKKRSGKRSWEKRWVVLTSRRLVYYDDQRKSRYINEVSKKKFRVIKKKDEDEKHFCLNGPSTVDWLFEAASPEEKKEWLERFEEFKPEKSSEERRMGRRARQIEEEKKEEIARITHEARVQALRAKLEELKEVLKQVQWDKLQELKTIIGNTKGALAFALEKMPGAETQRSVEDL